MSRRKKTARILVCIGIFLGPIANALGDADHKAGGRGGALFYFGLAAVPICTVVGLYLLLTKDPPESSSSGFAPPPPRNEPTPPPAPKKRKKTRKLKPAPRNE